MEMSEFLNNSFKEEICNTLGMGHYCKESICEECPFRTDIKYQEFKNLIKELEGVKHGN